MAERLAQGHAAVALLANAMASGLGLTVLILALGPVSGAHLNPVVSLSAAWQGRMTMPDALSYIAAQVTGAFAGVAAAHLMYEMPVFFAAEHVRTGPALWWSEFVATFGLIAIIIGCARSRPDVTPFAVGAYVTAGFWFTASSAYTNPAVTLAKAASNTFTGIRPGDAPAFIVAQVLGAAASTMLFCWLYAAPGKSTRTAAGPVMPRAASD